MGSVYEFEKFHHFATESNSVLPSDYVPVYEWMNDGAIALYASRVTYSHFLLTGISPVSEKPKVTFVTQEEKPKPLTARLMMILARKNIEMAASQLQKDGYMWTEIEPYLRNIQKATQDFEQQHKPCDMYFYYVVVNRVGDSE